jgi:hypothetical protein
LNNTATTGFTRILKISKNNVQAWSNQYGNTSGYGSGVALQEIDATHFAVLADYIDADPLLPHVWLFEIDNSGTIIWQQHHSCFGYNYELPRAFTKTTDGGFLIAAKAVSNSDAQIWLLKTTAAGIHQWDTTYGGPSYDDATSIIPSGDGGYLISGSLRETVRIRRGFLKSTITGKCYGRRLMDILQ